MNMSKTESAPKSAAYYENLGRQVEADNHADAERREKEQEEDASAERVAILVLKHLKAHDAELRAKQRAKEKAARDRALAATLIGAAVGFYGSLIVESTKEEEE